MSRNLPNSEETHQSGSQNTDEIKSGSQAKINGNQESSQPPSSQFSQAADAKKLNFAKTLMDSNSLI